MITKFNTSLIDKGYYPSMSVGMADNLVGRGDVQDAQINFRPSAGEANITDHAARIERIKGNSVVWNQKRYNNIAGNTYSFNVSRIGRIYRFDNASSAYARVSVGDEAIIGHKYLLRCKVIANEFALAVITSNSGSMRQDSLELPTSGYADAVVTKTISATNNNWTFMIYDDDFASKYAELEIEIIDLTQMFSTGNEPTSYEEYLQRKPMNIEDEYAYNAGTLVDMKATSLISTSDNAYDYTKGYARVMGGQKYDITTSTGVSPQVEFENDKGEIGAEFEIVDGKYIFSTDGYLTFANTEELGDICVCLNHSYNKPHSAYQQEVKDLSFIGEAFPNGMRSAGSAYDEIRYNRTTKKWEAVKRIGDATNLTFVSGSANLFATSIPQMKKPSTAAERLDGVRTTKYTISSYAATNNMEDKTIIRFPTTNNIYIKDVSYSSVADFNEANKDLVIYYELAEPIVVTLDYPTAEINMDYFAWDFGTEEAIASVPSAPFRADINYEPNAVDDLRWAVSEIRKLRAELAQMSASETNLTE